jgi:hypothetical protein
MMGQGLYFLVPKKKSHEKEKVTTRTVLPIMDGQGKLLPITYGYGRLNLGWEKMWKSRAHFKKSNGCGLPLLLLQMYISKQ